jgi:hypothetical protein
MTPAVFAAAFAVGLVIAILLYLVVITYNDVVALERRIDRPGRTSRSSSSSGTTSCLRWWTPSAA